jgi:hypothetical protein
LAQAASNVVYLAAYRARREGAGSDDTHGLDIRLDAGLAGFRQSLGIACLKEV